MEKFPVGDVAQLPQVYLPKPGLSPDLQALDPGDGLGGVPGPEQVAGVDGVQWDIPEPGSQGGGLLRPVGVNFPSCQPRIRR